MEINHLSVVPFAIIFSYSEDCLVIFFIHLSIGGRLGCFHVLAIVNGAAINIGL